MVFDGSVSTDDVGVISYTWTFPDGSNSTLAKPTYIITTDGELAVLLEVKDGAGNVGTATHTIFATLEKPTVLRAVQSGKDLVISGKTDPFATVIVYIFSDPKTFTTKADKDGAYEIKIPTKELGEGKHSISVMAMSGSSNAEQTKAQAQTIKKMASVVQAVAVDKTEAQEGSEDIVDIKPISVTVEKPIVSNRTLLYIAGGLVSLLLVGLAVKKAEK